MHEMFPIEAEVIALTSSGSGRRSRLTWETVRALTDRSRRAGVLTALSLSSSRIGSTFKALALEAFSVVVGVLASWVRGEVSES